MSRVLPGSLQGIGKAPDPPENPGMRDLMNYHSVPAADAYPEARTWQGNDAQGKRISDGASSPADHPSSATASALVRATLKRELAKRVAETIGVGHRSLAQAHTMNSVLRVMAKECTALIDASDPSNEESLTKLARACVASVESIRFSASETLAAQTAMTMIVWSAQDVARNALRAFRSVRSTKSFG